MGASYDKLWHLLIDRHMSKTQLIKEAHISTNAMAHLGKNEDVRVEVLVKICNALSCEVDDIIVFPHTASPRSRFAAVVRYRRYWMLKLCTL